MSPLIRYQGSTQWITDSAMQTPRDPVISSYFQKTFHTTVDEKATASFTFNGSAVTVYGSFRANHGMYNAWVDDQPAQTKTGRADPPAFKQVLFRADGLSTDKEHFVTLQNLPSGSAPGPNGTVWTWLDIDRIEFSPPEVGKVYTTYIDDTSPVVKYSSGDWQSLTPAGYNEISSHLSYNPGESLSFAFNGSSVQLFGATNIDHGQYSVSLDGGKAQEFNGTQDFLAIDTTLFVASGLADGPHVITLSNLGGTRDLFVLDFDYAIIRSSNDPSTGAVPEAGQTTSPDTNTNSSSANASDASKPLPVGAIAGGAAGGGILLLGLLALLWFCLARRRGRRAATWARGRPTPNISTRDLGLNDDQNNSASSYYYPNKSEVDHLRGSDPRPMSYVPYQSPTIISNTDNSALAATIGQARRVNIPPSGYAHAIPSDPHAGLQAESNEGTFFPAQAPDTSDRDPSWTSAASQALPDRLRRLLPSEIASSQALGSTYGGESDMNTGSTSTTDSMSKLIHALNRPAPSGPSQSHSRDVSPSVPQSANATFDPSAPLGSISKAALALLYSSPNRDHPQSVAGGSTHSSPTRTFPNEKGGSGFAAASSVSGIDTNTSSTAITANATGSSPQSLYSNTQSPSITRPGVNTNILAPPPGREMDMGPVSPDTYDREEYEGLLPPDYAQATAPRSR